MFGSSLWPDVRDEVSARHAVRLSGLPVLLMGANAALLALITFARPSPNLVLLASSTSIALLLILLVFRIRGGHDAWIPFTLVLYAAFMGAHGFWSYFVWRLLGRTLVGDAYGVVIFICLLLMVSGFRGWRWLRSRNVSVSF